jgi:peptidoglycan/xylan/chitin deacetylase (PgdA/CDA1 family)
LSILLYHRVTRQPDPLFPDQVDARLFDRQLHLLKRFFRPMPLALAIRRLAEGSLPARAACITFDDGYADNAEVALPLLMKHGLSACFYVSTGYLDGGQMWNDSVIECIRHAGGDTLDLSAYGLGCHPIGTLPLRRQLIATLLSHLKYQPFATRQAMAARLHPAALSRPGPMMTSAQLRMLARSGMEIGAHTVLHPILSTLPDSAAHAEIANGKHHLEQLTGAPVRLFAYPNGKPGQDYGARDIEIVRQLGFDGAVTTCWGVSRPGVDLYQLPRFTPWDRSRSGFLLRLLKNIAR